MMERVWKLITAEQRAIARSNGIIYQTLISRLINGWPIHKAIKVRVRAKVDSDELERAIIEHRETKRVVELLGCSSSSVRRARSRIAKRNGNPADVCVERPARLAEWNDNRTRSKRGNG
jgi:hypothetical protein